MSRVSAHIRTPDILSCRRILCVQPHPDDMDIGWGATVARLTDGGAEVLYLSVTDDAAGLTGADAERSVEERAALRRDEQERAAALLGVADLLWLGYPDAGPWTVYDARNGIVDTIRRVLPDAVVTVDPWLPYEAHGDHRKTGLAAAEAMILAAFPAIGTVAVPRGLAIRAGGFIFTRRPNTVLDVGRYRDRKLRAVRAHRSQFDDDSIRELERIDAARGADLGDAIPCGYAEGCKIVDPETALHIMPEAAEL